jgi:S1-C subfamily serine protease
MKANPLACTLLVLLAVAVQSPAQQPATNAADTNFWDWTATNTSGAGEIYERALKLAEQGNANGQIALGFAYKGGVGVSQSYVEAAKWFHKAAEQDDADAQNYLGLMYEKGEGVPQDYVEAYKWYNLAAAQGNRIGIENRDKIVNLMTPDQIAEAQQLAREFVPRKESSSDNSTSFDSPTASGSGFFITDDGYLITNNHVVKDATKIRLFTSAGLIDAKVVQVDAANDLALLKADGQFIPLPITSSRSAQLGSTVTTIGFPDPGLQGFSPKLAKGEIASLSGTTDDPRYFQISVPVQPGNSGGALVDEHGNVVGIVSAKLDASAALAASGALPENVNYAVKSSLLLSFLESVPDVDAKLKVPNTQDEKFEDVVKSAQDAAVLVLVY